VALTLGVTASVGDQAGVWAWEMVMAGNFLCGTDLGSLPALGTGLGVGVGNSDSWKKVFCFLKKFFTICHQRHTIFRLPNHLFRYPHED